MLRKNKKEKKNGKHDTQYQALLARKKMFA